MVVLKKYLNTFETFKNRSSIWRNDKNHPAIKRNEANYLQ